MLVNIWTDGGVRTGGLNGPTGGKSGRAAIGIVIKNEDGETVFKKGMYLGDEVTVNEAEYSGLTLGLFKARELGATHVVAHLDSQLVAMQVQGVWACKQEHLKQYLAEAKAEMAGFEQVDVVWVPRERNQHADQLTREVLGE